MIEGTAGVWEGWQDRGGAGQVGSVAVQEHC